MNYLYVRELNSIRDVLNEWKEQSISEVDKINIYMCIGGILREAAIEGKNLSNLVMFLSENITKIAWTDILDFSRENMQKMVDIYAFYKLTEDTPWYVKQLSWEKHLIIFSYCTSVTEAVLYSMKAIENNWNINQLQKAILLHLCEKELAYFPICYNDILK